MIGGMKVKTSVTLSPEVLAGIDELAGDMSRSEFIEQTLTQHLRRTARDERDRRDAEAMARYAAELAAQAEEFIDLQVPLGESGDSAEELVPEEPLAATG